MDMILHAFTTPYWQMTMIDELIIGAVVMVIAFPFWYAASRRMRRESEERRKEFEERWSKRFGRRG